MPRHTPARAPETTIATRRRPPPLRRLVHWIRGALHRSEAATARSARRRFDLETIEPRMLLSADPFMASVGADALLQVSLGDGDDALLVRQTGFASDGGVIVDLSMGASAQTFGSNVLGIRSILVDGLAGNDSFRFLDVTVPTLLHGGLGDDTLLGPADDARWDITGPDSGLVGFVRFEGVENLHGAADNDDTFVFHDDGLLSGTVAGGDAGFDTVVLDGHYEAVSYAVDGADSGNIGLDGAQLRFTGMEPVYFSQAVADFVFDGSIFNDAVTLRDSADELGTHMEIAGTLAGDRKSVV